MIYLIMLMSARSQAMIPRLPLVLAGSLSLVACANHSAYTGPLAELPAAYRNTTVLDPAPRAVVEPADDRWWTAFGDPTLDRLVQEALAGSLDVEAASA